MVHGVVSDIREFTTHDGPGLRTTVFLKGCPLRCVWCHNPECLQMAPQTIRTAAGERLIGESMEPARLAALLNCQADIVRPDGGVTFSGGEPLLQAEFLEAVLDRLDNLHVVLDTSGYTTPEIFDRIARRVQLVYFDIKLIDAAAHCRFTGVDNGPILRNLSRLPALGTPFVARIPLIPSVTDSDENLGAIATALQGLSGLRRIDLLPYNRAAGGKYAPLGLSWNPPFDENQPVNRNAAPLLACGVPVTFAGRRLN